MKSIDQWNLHSLIAELTTELSLTPEQQFRLTAAIKRHVHHEKAGLLFRLTEYADGRRIFGPDNPDGSYNITGREPPKDVFLHNVLKEKFKTHKDLSVAKDEEIVTWDIGTHKYKRD